jgi:hypothetical protein
VIRIASTTPLSANNGGYRTRPAQARQGERTECYVRLLLRLPPFFSGDLTLIGKLHPESQKTDDRAPCDADARDRDTACCHYEVAHQQKSGQDARNTCLFLSSQLR